MISTSLQDTFEHATPGVCGTRKALQTLVSTQSFKVQAFINTEHKLGKTIASQERPLDTFSMRPLGNKFAGQSATALSIPDGMTSGQVDAPRPQAND